MLYVTLFPENYGVRSIQDSNAASGKGSFLVALLLSSMPMLPGPGREAFH